MCEGGQPAVNIAPESNDFSHTFCNVRTVRLIKDRVHVAVRGGQGNATVLGTLNAILLPQRRGGADDPRRLELMNSSCRNVFLTHRCTCGLVTSSDCSSEELQVTSQ